jgi:hypothetical protein
MVFHLFSKKEKKIKIRKREKEKKNVLILNTVIYNQFSIITSSPFSKDKFRGRNE